MAQEISIFAACQGMSSHLRAFFERFSDNFGQPAVQTEPSVAEPPHWSELRDPPAVKVAARADVGLVTVLVREGVQQVMWPVPALSPTGLSGQVRAPKWGVIAGSRVTGSRKQLLDSARFPGSWLNTPSCSTSSPLDWPAHHRLASRVISTPSRSSSLPGISGSKGR